MKTCIRAFYRVMLLYLVLSLPNKSLACFVADGISGATVPPEEFPAYGKVRKITNGSYCSIGLISGTEL